MDPTVKAEARARQVIRATPGYHAPGDDPAPEGRFAALNWAVRAAIIVVRAPAVWPLLHEELALLVAGAVRVTSARVRALAVEVKRHEPTSTEAYAVESRRRLRVGIQELRGLRSALAVLNDATKVRRMAAEESNPNDIREIITSERA